MRGYRLSPAAEADLEDIWTYTVDNWSPDQGQRYVSRLFDAFAAVAENPGLGQRVDLLMQGYRRLRCGHHLIFYIGADDDNVDVIRILHEKADVVRYLP
jgi:toxin ParE1/3/4